jgi:hypothetical protein
MFLVRACLSEVSLTYVLMMVSWGRVFILVRSCWGETEVSKRELRWGSIMIYFFQFYIDYWDATMSIVYIFRLSIIKQLLSSFKNMHNTAPPPSLSPWITYIRSECSVSCRVPRLYIDQLLEESTSCFCLAYGYILPD